MDVLYRNVLTLNAFGFTVGGEAIDLFDLQGGAVAYGVTRLKTGLMDRMQQLT